MSSLRLAFAYLRFIPSQHWLSVLAILLMVIGALAVDAIFMVGAVLLVFFPALFGGVAMRMASSGKGMALRPAGYRRMLSGALLATLLLTAMHVVPLLAAVQLEWIWVRRDFRELVTAAGGASYALLAWSIIATCWLAMFCLVNIPLLGLLLVPVLTIVPALLSRNSKVAACLEQLSLPFATFPLLVVASWLVFAAWYLRRRVMRSPTQSMAAFVQRLVNNKARRSARDDAADRKSALRAYLLGGSISWRDLSLSIGIVMVTALPLALIAAQRPGPRPFIWVVFAMYLVVGGPSLALTVMRRARFLWLKAGADRLALFGIVERMMVQNVAVLLLALGIALELLTAFVQPEALAMTLLFNLAFAAFGFSMMYAALCFVRPWKSAYLLPILLCLGAWGYMAWRLLPSREPAIATFVAAILGSLALAAVLRLLARWRWRRIDWQLLRPLALGRPDRGVHDA